MRYLLGNLKLVPALLLAAILAAPGTSAAATIAFFDNGLYVDTDPEGDSEADYLRATLEAAGHTVQTFTGIADFEISAALAGVDLVVFPEIENSDLGAALDVNAILELHNFVTNEGGLIALGGSSLSVTFLNTVFGYSMNSSSVGTTSLTANAEGTAYELLSASVPALSTTRAVFDSSLPARTLSIYKDSDESTVFRIPFGSGRIVYLGWDWSGASPLGSQDGGWLAVLDAALADSLECGLSMGTDTDLDGLTDGCDNCPVDSNASQLDSDSDGLGDACDNCPSDFNPGQENADADTEGDACDDDIDGDGFDNSVDLCPLDSDPLQVDGDGDAIGDACDACPTTYNPGPDFFGAIVAWRDALEAEHALITAHVPDRHDFIDGDTGSLIADGGLDMYDGGNLLSYEYRRGSTTRFDNMAYTDGAVSGRFAWGNGRWFTAKHPGLFALVMHDFDNVQSLQIGGDTGADGLGSVDSTALSTVINDRSYTIFVKRVFGAGDASINHIVVVPGSGSGITQTVSPDSNLDDHSIAGLNSVTSLFYLLVSRATGDKLEDADVLAVADEFLTRVIIFGALNTDGDALPDVCDPDNDNDGILDGSDNCPQSVNPLQENSDGDDEGDVCDSDADNDGVIGASDNCPTTPNPDQDDSDGDDLGDLCDACALDDLNDEDGDTVCGDIDNCPVDANMTQADGDADGVGDICDACTTVSPEQEMAVKPALRIRFVSRDLDDRNRLRFAGEFAIPGTGFSAFEPLVTPVRVSATTRFAPMFDVVLPTTLFASNGGVGWRLNRGGNKWKFKDRSATPAEGITSVVIQDRNKRNPDGVRISVRGKKGSYVANRSIGFPHQGRISWGDPTAGDCSESRFIREDCRLDATRSKASCVRK